MSRRLERVNDLLRQEISDILRRQLKDPRLAGLISVTQVVISPDLAAARAYVSVLGEAGDKESTLGALRHAAPFVRRELGRRLTMRRIPHVTFLLDESIERGAYLSALIREATNPADKE